MKDLSNPEHRESSGKCIAGCKLQQWSLEPSRFEKRFRQASRPVACIKLQGTAHSPE